MTLSDADRATVNLHGKTTTIAEIAKLVPPKRIVAARTTAFQRRVWRLHAVVDRYRIASNGEIVLDPLQHRHGPVHERVSPEPTLPRPRARATAPAWSLRGEQFTSHCAPVTAAWQLLGATVDVAGVGFWNPSKRTRGALPNGAELRPLTNLRIVSGCGVG